MSTPLSGPRPPGVSLHPLLGGWLLLVLFLQSACATGTSRSRSLDSPTPPSVPKRREASTAEPGLESATVYGVDFLEPGSVPTSPVRISRAEFQQAFLRLSRDVRLKHKTPRQAAHELLSLLEASPDVPRVEAKGDWTL
ncbi:MAG TPA: hypothetical protein VF664_06005, partial [Cystobacter sp.]